MIFFFFLSLASMARAFPTLLASVECLPPGSLQHVHHTNTLTSWSLLMPR
jgi:hypothetical protein